MSNLNTELMNALLKNASIDEFFRQQLETAINGLLQAELSAFPGYEKHDPDGRNTGNSRNGSYSRTFDTRYGTLNLQIPRDRNCVAREALPVIPGITPDGYKEVPDYAFFPSESAANYGQMLSGLKQRGWRRFCCSSLTACRVWQTQ